VAPASDQPPYHRAVTDSRPSSGPGPSVCPFVALAEDRERRADTPDEGNRCYAERAPRRRDMVYQADYCYSPQFSACSVFLAWAARNAAEPAYVTEAAQKAWGSGIAAPEGEAEVLPTATDDEEELPIPTPEGGLFGPADPDDPEQSKGSEQLDWVSASAWTEAPWDDRAEQEAEELAALADEEPEEEEPEPEEEEPEAEATQGPKVPAALPMRRRKPPQQPIRSRGSGEWFYADPPGSEPLVKRRYSVTPPVLLAVLGLLVVAIVVFLVAAQLGGSPGERAAAPSPSAASSVAPVSTRAPLTTAAPSVAPSPTPTPKARFYKVKSGDSLTRIALKFGVDAKLLQCINGILDKNVVVLGARYEIPPEGYTCPPGWRNAAGG
jgi:LysM repeat protein